MTARLTTVLVTLLAIGGLVAGCGGDDGGGGGGSGSLSEEEYVEQANAICDKNAEERVERLESFAEERPNQSQSELLKTASEKVYAPSMEDLAAEIRELDTPSGDERQVERIEETFAEVAKAAKAGGGNLMTRRIGAAIRQARAAARAYGLYACEFQ